MTQAESPEWMPASSMCCITPPMTTRVAVAQAIDIDLDGRLQELVDQDRLAAATPRAPAATKRANALSS